MLAHIVKTSQFAVLATNDHDVFVDYLCCQVVARLDEVMDRSSVDPATEENVLSLPDEDALVRVRPPRQRRRGSSVFLYLGFARLDAGSNDRAHWCAPYA